MVSQARAKCNFIWFCWFNHNIELLGNGVTKEDTKVSAGAGIEVGVSTITINKANLNIQDSADSQSQELQQ